MHSIKENVYVKEPTLSANTIVEHENYEYIEVKVKRSKLLLCFESFGQILKFQIESIPWSILMAIVTIYALFCEDIRITSFNKESDYLFTILTSITFILFLFEFTLLCLWNPNYIWSFFFWLDLVALVSHVPDVPWIWNEFVPNNDSFNSAAHDLTVTRAGRASRIGTRAGRIVRFLRIIRILKMYKYCTNTMKNVFAKEENSVKMETKIKNQQTRGMDMESINGSSVGRQLSDLTTRRVIVGVLLMLFIIPILHVPETDMSTEYFLFKIDQYMNNQTLMSNQTFHQLIYAFTTTKSIVYLSINSTLLVNNEVNNLRMNEIVEYKSMSAEVWVSIFDESFTNALYNMILTIFILFLLLIGSMVFTRDAYDIVIEPIERMIQFVKRLAENPFGELNQAKSVQQQNVKNRNRRHETMGNDDGDSSEEVQFETNVLEDTLVKLGSLLQVGFGRAGAEIIAKNLDSGDTTECLQSQVMIFVNQIAAIVHGICNKYAGSPNKNVGDAFLMVWGLDKSPDECISLTQRQSVSMGDQALVAFAHSLIDCMKSDALSKWRTHPNILTRLPHLGCGIHCGWAIQGAIGSERKIDASYLGSNVNLCMMFEEKTKTYGVSILFSEQVWNIMTPNMQSLCRKLDRVHLQNEPFDLYTFDITQQAIDSYVSMPLAPNAPKLDGYVNIDFQVEVLPLQMGLPSTFVAKHTHAVNMYIAGQWADAKHEFEDLMILKKTDQARDVIMGVMSASNFVAPLEWQGYHGP